MVWGTAQKCRLLSATSNLPSESGTRILKSKNPLLASVALDRFGRRKQMFDGLPGKRDASHTSEMFAGEHSQSFAELEGFT